MNCENIDELIGVRIGKGVQGSVFEYKGNPEWVIKKTAKRAREYRENTEKEFSISMRAGAIGVAPKIIDGMICGDDKGKDTGYFVMEKIVGRTLQKEDLSDDGIISKITNKINKLREHKIEYGDYNVNNILIGRIGSGEEDVYIIDFGGSKYYNSVKEIEKKTNEEIKRILTIGFGFIMDSKEKKRIIEEARVEATKRQEEAIERIMKSRMKKTIEIKPKSRSSSSRKSRSSSSRKSRSGSSSKSVKNENK